MSEIERIKLTPPPSGFSFARNKEKHMKIFSSLASLDQIRGSPLSPMLREMVVRMAVLLGLGESASRCTTAAF